jgi:VanZ family protein
MAIGALVVSLALYVVYNWTPFDFAISGDVIRPRIPMIFDVPFHAYYVNPELKAIGDLLVKISLGVPIGICLSWWIGSRTADYRRVAISAAVVSTALFLMAVEAGQILLPTRYPDNTDILLGAAGVLGGSWIGRLSLLRPERDHR